MIEAEYLLEDSSAVNAPAAPPEAPNSWDPAGRNVPAAKLDWTECLHFRYVRGVEVPQDHFPHPDQGGPSPGD